MAEILKVKDGPEKLHITSGMLSATIGMLIDYVKQVGCCEECKLERVCKKGFNTCPRFWKKEIVKD